MKLAHRTECFRDLGGGDVTLQSIAFFVSAAGARSMSEFDVSVQAAGDGDGTFHYVRIARAQWRQRNDFGSCSSPQSGVSLTANTASEDLVAVFELEMRNPARPRTSLANGILSVVVATQDASVGANLHTQFQSTSSEIDVDGPKYPLSRVYAMAPYLGVGTFLFLTMALGAVYMYCTQAGSASSSSDASEPALAKDDQ